jgi:hypothetical protein
MNPVISVRPSVCPFICLPVGLCAQECNTHKTDLRGILYLALVVKFIDNFRFFPKIGHDQNTLQMKTWTSVFLTVYGLHN